MYGVRIKTNAREARILSAIVSPTRSFVPTGQRGVYVMETDDEILAIRDADFLAERGVEVLGIDER